MVTGLQLLRLAEAHLGERYENVLVPKDNPNWHGPWDCAEFASWVVFQKTGRLYGCINDNANPAVADAYSGAWADDVGSGRLLSTTENDADTAAGVVLIRKPPVPGTMGHIAVSDGRGGTVEAAGVRLGVKRDKVRGRVWDLFARIPAVDYSVTSEGTAPVEAPTVLRLQKVNVKGANVRRVQRALKDLGFDPGKIDGEYGPHTMAAVAAFQTSNRLVADGIVGPRTAKKLGVDIG
jgi:hypothetical protein